MRVAVWRRLRRLGVLPLGNSGYLLPNSPQNRERFEWLATTIRSGRGDASVVEVKSIDNHPASLLAKSFNEARARDYRELIQEIRKLSGRASKMATSRVTQLRQRFQEIVSIDYFDSDLRGQAERALKEYQMLLAGDAKHEERTTPRSEYRGRIWVTRPRPGVDRVSSAWLIREFIDPKARFAFSSEEAKPERAVPFDMYDGGFGHRGDDCTFETLARVFRIRDRRVGMMAQMIHDADLFDEKFGRKEGFGIDEVLKGWARQGVSDKDLLKRGIQLMEGLYHSLR